jgi:hypothetical protein
MNLRKYLEHFLRGWLPKEPVKTYSQETSKEKRKPYWKVLTAAAFFTIIIVVAVVLLATPKIPRYPAQPAALPQGGTDTIPLGLNYTVGERMTYQASLVYTDEDFGF